MRHLDNNDVRDRLSQEEYDEAMGSTRMLGCVLLGALLVIVAVGAFLLGRALS